MKFSALKSYIGLFYNNELERYQVHNKQATEFWRYFCEKGHTPVSSRAVLVIEVAKDTNYDKISNLFYSALNKLQEGVREQSVKSSLLVGLMEF